MPSSFSKSANHLWRLLGRNPTAERADMSGQYVIVTGASPQSLGYETARILASWGASVVVTSTRNAARMADCLKADLRRIGADERRVAAQLLDLCDVESVNGFATWYRKNYGDRLHVLINNAGVHKNILTPAEEASPEQGRLRDSLAHQLSRCLSPHKSTTAAPETQRPRERRRAGHQRVFPSARQSEE